MPEIALYQEIFGNREKMAASFFNMATKSPGYI